MTDSSTHPTSPAELVERLAREAGADAWDVYRSPPGNLMISVDGIEIEPEIRALVQLVARECARICKETGAYRDDDDLVAECVAAIRDRFGIKE